MTQGLDGPAMKFPANDCPDRGGQRQQKIVLAGESVHEKHAEDHHGQCQHDAQDEQIALARAEKAKSQSPSEEA